jgi:hypothetical protein
VGTSKAKPEWNGFAEEGGQWKGSWRIRHKVPSKKEASDDVPTL